MRLFDAETFLEALENADADVCETYPDFYCDWGFSHKAIVDLLLNIPTIEAKPVVHGKWKLHKDGSGTCDQCHFTQPDVWDMDNWDNFCSHCGAEMRERKENGTNKN